MLCEYSFMRFAICLKKICERVSNRMRQVCIFEHPNLRLPPGIHLSGKLDGDGVLGSAAPILRESARRKGGLMPSFDIVNEIDLQEVDNAVNNVRKEVETRYDFKGVITEMEFNRKTKVLSLVTGDEMKIRAIRDMLISHFVRRKVDPKAMEFGEPENTSRGQLKQEIKLHDGIDKDAARKLVKMIKDSKLKVQAAIQDEQVRVSGKADRRPAGGHDAFAGIEIRTTAAVREHEKIAGGAYARLHDGNLDLDCDQSVDRVGHWSGGCVLVLEAAPPDHEACADTACACGPGLSCFGNRRLHHGQRPGQGESDRQEPVAGGEW
jgi:cyclic-di-GMP-binding protein